MYMYIYIYIYILCTLYLILTGGALNIRTAAGEPPPTKVRHPKNLNPLPQLCRQVWPNLPMHPTQPFQQ